MAQTRLHRLIALLVSACLSCGAALKISQDSGGLALHSDNSILHHSLLAGSSPETIVPNTLKASTDANSAVASNGAHLSWNAPSATRIGFTLKAAPNSTEPLWASLDFPADELFYGVWEYPWNGRITNDGVSYGDIGPFGELPGINWASARAPFFFTRSGYGVYVDSDAYGKFDFPASGGEGAKKSVRFAFNTSVISYTILYDRNLTALLMDYAKMSNTINMPVDSGFGPIFWSDDAEVDFHGSVSNAQENFNDFVDHLYWNKIRATAMFADRPYGTGNRSFGNFDFDPKFYPNVTSFIANLTTWGFDFQAWVANRAFLDTELYNVSKANGWLFPGVDPVQFLGPALNLSIPAAYDYFLEKLAFYGKIGVKGFKVDRGEEHEMPDAEQNVQMTLFQEICHKAMTKAHGTNFYTFSRSVFDRSRNLTAVWNGDAQATFTGLRYSVASGIRAGLLGFAQWGSDTGGYLRDNFGNIGAPSEELFARWMHFSALSPMYEVLIGGGHTPWYDYSPRLMGVLKSTTDLHVRLVPYIRSYVHAATKTGLPVMRALFLDFPNDDKVNALADEYMFGKELLVAPIVAEGGSRDVYFPRGGGRFLEYFNKTEVYEPGQTLSITGAPLEYGPLYVREGAIVVTGDVYQGNAKWVEQWTPQLEIELYPSFEVASSNFEYYRGKESLGGVGGTAVISMATQRSGKVGGNVTVSVAYLGVTATIKVFSRAENGSVVTRTERLVNRKDVNEQIFVFDNIVSLFK